MREGVARSGPGRWVVRGKRGVREDRAQERGCGPDGEGGRGLGFKGLGFWVEFGLGLGSLFYTSFSILSLKQTNKV